MKDVIKNLSLFKGLEDSDYEKIAQVAQKGSIPVGTVFCQEGEIGESFFVLEEGEVEVSKVIDGQKKVLTTIKSSDESNFFGEMALIEGVPRNATIVALTNCQILEIEKKNFDMLLRINSFISLRIMAALTKRLRGVEVTGIQQAVKVDGSKPCKVITFFSPKGGAGKTTMATNVAAGIAMHLKKRVLVLDLDLQFGGIAFMLGLKAGKTLADIAANENELKSFDDIKPCLLSHKSGFQLLPAPLKPEQSEMFNSNHLRKIINLSKPNYDYILLDTHSLLQDVSINALDISDEILMLLNPDMGHLMAIHNCSKVMKDLKYPEEKIHLVLNRFGVKLGMSLEDIQGVLKKVHYTIHDDWNNAINLVNERLTIFDSNAASEYRADVVKLIEGITEEKMPAELSAAPKNSGGLLKSFTNWLNS